MEINPLTSLFSSPKTTSESKKDEPSICDTIISIVKEAIDFFVSMITCGQVKVFEATDEGKSEEAGGGSGGSSNKSKAPSVAKALEKAVKAANINQEHYTAHLLALSFAAEIFQCLCAKREKVTFEGKKDPAGLTDHLSIVFPESLRKDGGIKLIEKVCIQLIKSFMTTCNFSKTPVDPFDVIDPSKDYEVRFAFRRLGDDEVGVVESFSRNYSYALRNLFSNMRIARTGETEPIHGNDLLRDQSSPQLLALEVIIDVILKERDPLCSYLRAVPASEMHPARIHLATSNPTQVEHKGFDFARRLLPPTWKILNEYVIAKGDDPCPFRFGYDKDTDSLVLDKHHLEKFGYTLLPISI